LEQDSIEKKKAGLVKLDVESSEAPCMSNRYQYNAKTPPSGAQSHVSTVDDAQEQESAEEPLTQSETQQAAGLPPAEIPPTPRAQQAGSTPSAIASVPARSARRRRQPRVFALGVLLVLAALACGVWRLNANAAPNVVLYKVSQQQITMNVGGGGLIYPYQQLVVTYPVAERVVRVLVKAGQQVTPNQSLVQLDPSQLNVQIKQAADDVTAARAYLNSISFYGTAVAIAAAQQQYDLAVNRYNALVAQASSPLLHNGNLISTMNGIVTTVNVNPGEVFAANAPLVTIMDESTVVLRVKVPLSNLAQVHPGQAVTVTPSALPDVTMHGTVSAIIPQADPQTNTFEAWVSVVNSGDTLLPGMSAFANIQTPTRALAVPRLAVLNLDSSAAVFVVRNQRAHLQPVQVVGRSVDTIFVNGGITAGDQLVLVGANSVQDGQLVHITRIEG
jgi:RND family efflux transporter MFP subunit